VEWDPQTSKALSSLVIFVLLMPSLAVFAAVVWFCRRRRMSWLLAAIIGIALAWVALKAVFLILIGVG